MSGINGLGRSAVVAVGLVGALSLAILVGRGRIATIARGIFSRVGQQRILPPPPVVAPVIDVDALHAAQLRVELDAQRARDREQAEYDRQMQELRAEREGLLASMNSDEQAAFVTQVDRLIHLAGYDYSHEVPGLPELEMQVAIERALAVVSPENRDAMVQGALKLIHIRMRDRAELVRAVDAIDPSRRDTAIISVKAIPMWRDLTGRDIAEILGLFDRLTPAARIGILGTLAREVRASTLVDRHGIANRVKELARAAIPAE